jgi:hypothetical protein
MPANPSISFSLKACVSQTKVHFKPQSGGGVRFSLSGQQNPDFQTRIEKFLNSVELHYPWLREYALDIASTNSFPHSSGIASSASGFAALALCVEQIDQHLRLTAEQGSAAHHPEPSAHLANAHFLNRASQLARLGSGSACRSVYGGWVQWGMHPATPESRNEYAIAHQSAIHPVFTDYRDTILLIHKGVKQTGSTAGHKLMEGNPISTGKRADPPAVVDFGIGRFNGIRFIGGVGGPHPSCIDDGFGALVYADDAQYTGRHSRNSGISQTKWASRALYPGCRRQPASIVSCTTRNGGHVTH